jgi:sortase A
MTLVDERPPEVVPPVAPPLQPRRQVMSYALSLLSLVIFVLLVQLTLVSQLQHFTAQKSLYKELRLHLAEGSVPIGQQDINGHLVAPGTPLALLEIPEIGVREVVVEGTTSRQTQLGVGHRRDTPLPGQAGVSVLMGRASAYGAVFGKLDELQKGDKFTVTTGQGVSTYEVIGPRTSQTKLPMLAAGDGRLTLTTASGRPFMPDGVLRVDATLVSPAFAAPPAAIASGDIAPAEQALAGDPSVLFSLSWWLELLVLLSLAAVWAWKRWGHRGTWIAFTPLLAAVALANADRISCLLPNLV